jgi:hypothetical protein
MNTICDCGTPTDELARRAECDDCGSACCRNCQVDVAAQTYCGRCAPAFVAA